MSRFKKIISGVLAFTLTTQSANLAFAGGADDIRKATSESHRAARAVAVQLLNNRLSEAMTRLMSAFVYQQTQIDMLTSNNADSYQNVMSKLKSDIEAFGTDSPTIGEDIQAVAKAKLDAYVDMENRFRGVVARSQTAVTTAYTLDRQIDELLLSIENVCKVGESSYVPSDILPSLKTPVPDLTIKINGSYSGGTSSVYPSGSASSPGAGPTDYYGMGATVGTAALMQFGGMTMLGAGLVAGGAVVVVAIVVWAVGFFGAIEQADQLHAASIDHFYNQANSGDVAKYYRESCETISETLQRTKQLLPRVREKDPAAIAEAEAIEKASAETIKTFGDARKNLVECSKAIAAQYGVDLEKPLPVQDQKAVAAYNEALAADAEYKAQMAKLNAITSNDIMTLVSLAVLQLARVDGDVKERLLQVGQGAENDLHTKAFGKLVRTVFQAYKAGFAKAYPDAILAVSRDLKISGQIAELRRQTDQLVGKAITALFEDRNTLSVISGLVQVQVELGKIKDVLRGKKGTAEVQALIDAIQELVKVIK